MRTRTCYFAKLRPCASIIVYASFACLPLYFVAIEFIVLDLVVVSLCVNSQTSNYVVCAVAAEGDNVFESVMVCFTQASNCGADRHPGGGDGGSLGRPRYDPY